MERAAQASRVMTNNADGGADRLSRARLRQQDMGTRGCVMTPLTPHWGGGRPTSDTCQSALDEVSVVLGPGACPCSLHTPIQELEREPACLRLQNMRPFICSKLLVLLGENWGFELHFEEALPSSGPLSTLVRGSSPSIPHPLKCQRWALSRSLLMDPLCRGPA